MSSSRSFRFSGLRRGALAAALLLGAPAARAASGAPPTDASVTSPADLKPPQITVLKNKPGTARGLIFVAPKVTPSTNIQQGPEIIDNQGRPIWFQPIANGDQAADFRVQSYRGAPVLTYWEGQSHTGPGHGEGVDYVLDQSYQVIATVQAGHGYAADTHEFRLTPRGTALITVYNQIPYDLSSVGGPANGAIFDSIAQEIDIATGKVLFEWHSIEHVGVDESEAPVPTTAASAYDYFHINAVNEDLDGNYLIDARNTWATYKVDRWTGKVLWRLAGKKTDFTLGPGGAFAWQHDPEPVDRFTVRIFDDEASPTVLPASRVIWIRRDPFTHTARLLRAFQHPDGISTGSQGNSQALENGDTFVGWGAAGRFSEFNEAGDLLFDANVPGGGWDDYRAYRNVWQGRPRTLPTATATPNGDGTITVHAIWNGATDVRHWYVVGGDHPTALWPLGTAAWNGLDTTITVHGEAQSLAVVAQDEYGRILARSEAVTVGE